MAWIVPQIRLVFLHAPRTAGSTIARFLQQQLDAYPWHPNPSAPYHVKDHDIIVPDACQDWQIITTVRNPFSRELSLYFWRQISQPENDSYLCKVARTKTFGEYMLERKAWPRAQNYRNPFGTQNDYLAGVNVSDIIHYEALPDALLVVSPHLLQYASPFREWFAAQCWRASPRYLIEDYYTDETRELVAEYAADDFVRFGYDPTRLPEAQA